MPLALESDKDTLSAVDPPRRVRWTRRQCQRLAEIGLLTGRYELIEGDILSKMGQNPPHSIVVRLLVAALIAVFGEQFVMSQLPVNVPDGDETSEPEPDVAVTVAPIRAFQTQHPGPTDLRLVVEVSDTTLRFDRSIKAPLYARAGVTEYWIVDLPNRQLIVHRQPTPTGYSSILAYAENESVATLTRPETLLIVRDILPTLP